MGLINKIREGNATLILKKPLKGQKRRRHRIYVLPQADGKSIHFYYENSEKTTTLDLKYVKDIVYHRKLWRR